MSVRLAVTCGDDDAVWRRVNPSTGGIVWCCAHHAKQLADGYPFRVYTDTDATPDDVRARALTILAGGPVRVSHLDLLCATTGPELARAIYPLTEAGHVVVRDVGPDGEHADAGTARWYWLADNPQVLDGGGT